MKLTAKQRDQLWGETGPYSEVHLCTETRILDDSVSRIFLSVTISVNPFTYEVIEQNRDQFKDDQMIQQLLDHSEYRGQADGYVSSAFLAEYNSKKVMKEAQEAVVYAKETIMRMHIFILEILRHDYRKAS